MPHRPVQRRGEQPPNETPPQRAESPSHQSPRPPNGSRDFAEDAISHIANLPAGAHGDISAISRRYLAQVLTAERSLAFLVECHLAGPMARRRDAAGRRSDAAGRLEHWLLSCSQTGVAPLFILVNALFAAMLVWMPYTLLVEFSMLLSVPSILLFMWAFVALRLQRPDAPRPFVIPGGLGVAIAIVVVPVAISIAYATIVFTQSAQSRDGSRSDDARPDYQARDRPRSPGDSPGSSIHPATHASRDDQTTLSSGDGRDLVSLRPVLGVV